MPNNASQADFFLEWEQLMTAADEYKELLPSAGPYLQQMKETSAR